MAIFDSKKHSNETLNGFLGPGAEFEGTLRFPELLRVDGTVRGKVISKKELVVGESGRVDAEIDVGQLSVAGHVSGKIIVRDRMEIHAGGRVSGEIHMKTLRLVLEEGAILEGTIQMGEASETETRSDPDGAEEADGEAKKSSKTEEMKGAG